MNEEKETLTVGELIEKLSRYDKNAQAIVVSSTTWFDIKGVCQSTNGKIMIGDIEETDEDNLDIVSEQ